MVENSVPAPSPVLIDSTKLLADLELDPSELAARTDTIENHTLSVNKPKQAHD